MIPQVNLKNLPKNMDRVSLENFCLKFGRVASVRVNVDDVTGRSVGTAQVRFETQDAANRAKKEGFWDLDGVRVEVT